MPPVLYDLYFLPPQFHFLSNLVPVVYEKTEMVHPSNFPSKTNVQPRHPTGVGVHGRHLSPCTPQPEIDIHVSLSTATSLKRDFSKKLGLFKKTQSKNISFRCRKYHFS